MIDPGMGARDRGRGLFLKLPPQVQRSLLRAAGRLAPWDVEFDVNAPPCPAGLVTGPPDFVGVGAQKAGTTWWYSLIAQHPAVYHHDGFHKERHFFGHFALEEFGPAQAGLYSRWFPRPPGLLSGEWTPDYMHQPWVPGMLTGSAPDAKLLVLVRDPTARFRSGVDHLRQRGEPLTPMALGDAVSRGFYSAQIARLHDAFPPERILVLVYEACVENPRRWLGETFRFLGIDDTFVPSDMAGESNRTRVAPTVLGPGVEERLNALYKPDVDLLGRLRPELDLGRWRCQSTGLVPG